MHNYTIEDCLEFLVGHRNIPGTSWRENKFTLFPENRKVLQSIGTQVFRGKALTEKQHVLVKELLVKWYSEQFFTRGIDIKQHVDLLREQYRVVDKSHWVKRTTKHDTDFISIRFPFSNQVIEHITELKKNTAESGYYYKNHTHNFVFTEDNVHKVVKIALQFSEQFDIDEDILNYYKEVEQIIQDEHKYIPGVYNFEYKNISDTLKDYLKNRYGELTNNNITNIWDKRRLYGLHHFDDLDLTNYSSLSQKILLRKYSNLHIRSKVWTMSQLVASIDELDRFPLLVLLNEDTAFDELSTLYNEVKGFIPNEQISVMFRLDSKTGGEFNQFIRDKVLNNNISNDTKIVIASRKKITKPIIKSDWTPVSMLTFGGSRFPGYVVDGYLESFDLKFYYTPEDSIISAYSKKKNYITGVESV